MTSYLPQDRARHRGHPRAWQKPRVAKTARRPLQQDGLIGQLVLAPALRRKMPGKQPPHRLHGCD